MFVKYNHVSVYCVNSNWF